MPAARIVSTAPIAPRMYHRISFFGFSVFIFFASDCSS
jgi:hypothetical protein